MKTGKIASYTNSTDTLTGSLIVAGGVAIGHDVHGGGNLTVRTINCDEITTSKANFPATGNTACLFFNNSDASTYADHKVLSLNFNNHAESKVETAVGDSADVLIQQFATDLNGLNIVVINDGVYELSLTSSISAGSTTVYFKLYHYNGATETLIGTSSLVDITDTATEIYNKLAVAKLAFNGSTDRLIIRLYATKLASGSATVTTLFEGSSNIGFVYSPIIQLTPSTIPCLSITNNTASTDTGTGCLITKGGCAIQGNLHVGGTITGSNLTNTNSGDITLTSIGSTANANGASLSGQQLQLQPAGTEFGGVVTTGTQSFAGNKTFTDTTASTSTGTGALVVAGGIGCAKSIYSGQTITCDNVQGGDPGFYMKKDGTNQALFYYDSVGGISLVDYTNNSVWLSQSAKTKGSVVSLNNTLDNGSGDMKVAGTTASTSTNTGALVVSGGLGVAGTGNFGGGLVAGGNISCKNITTSDSSYGFEIFAPNNIPTIRAAHWGTDYVPVHIGALSQLVVDNTTDSISTSTGALLVSGGIGSVGSINAGGVIAGRGTLPGSANGKQVYVGYDNSVGDGVGIIQSVEPNVANRSLTINPNGGTVNIGAYSVCWVQNNTDSTSTATGALIVSGGIGCGGTIYCAGLNVNGSSLSTPSSTSFTATWDGVISPSPTSTVYCYKTGNLVSLVISGVYGTLTTQSYFSLNAGSLLGSDYRPSASNCDFDCSIYDGGAVTYGRVFLNTTGGIYVYKGLWENFDAGSVGWNTIHVTYYKY
jgi:hypothetical protein